MGLFSYVREVAKFMAVDTASQPLDGGLPSVTGHDVEWTTSRELPRRDSGVFWGGLRIPKSQNCHYLMVGMPRSGKTVLLRLLMQDVLPDTLLGRNTRALIYDPKEEMAPILAGMGLRENVRYLHPYDRRSYAWNMCHDVTQERHADILATTLVPDDHGEHNRFFTKAVRTLVRGVITTFIHSGLKWTFRDLMAVLLDPKHLEAVASLYPLVRTQYEAFIAQGREETARDVWSSIQASFNQYFIIASLWHHAQKLGREISLRDWLHGNEILVLPSPAGEGDAIILMNQLLFRWVASLLLHDLPDNVGQRNPSRTWIILDELRLMGRLPRLGELLTAGASRGARMVMTFQDIEGMRSALGSHDAHEIAGLCANHAFLKAGTDETAHWMSRHFQMPGSGGGPPRTLESHLFMGLPLPGRLHHTLVDFQGFYRSERLPAYHGSLSAKQVFARLCPLHPTEPRYDPRPNDQQILEPWSADELRQFLQRAARPAAMRIGGPALRRPSPQVEPRTEDLIQRLFPEH